MWARQLLLVMKTVFKHSFKNELFLFCTKIIYMSLSLMADAKKIFCNERYFTACLFSKNSVFNTK